MLYDDDGNLIETAPLSTPVTDNYPCDDEDDYFADEFDDDDDYFDDGLDSGEDDDWDDDDEYEDDDWDDDEAILGEFGTEV